MPVAELLLEYVRALAWPLVTLILVLRFQRVLTRILQGLGERLRTADKLKFGVMGQEVELSGTAQELLQRHDELLQAGGDDAAVGEQAAQIEESARRLQNPIADIVGIELLRVSSAGLTIEAIVQKILSTFAPQREQPQLMLIAMATEAEKIVDALVRAELANRRGDRVVLTPRGVEIFRAVEKKQSAFLKRFGRLAK